MEIHEATAKILQLKVQVKNWMNHINDLHTVLDQTKDSLWKLA